MKKIVTGILAHVDAGKTTLSEALLYTTGAIRKHGRVDNKDAFLDTDTVEKEKGITIYSKQARFNIDDEEIILVDTPGHVDFSTEMERALCILDYAILLISGSEGIQPHTLTLWKLLSARNIPTFIFVNKMDMPGADKEGVLSALRNKLSNDIVDFTDYLTDPDTVFEEAATSNQNLLDEYISEGSLSVESIAGAVTSRHLFPCMFGSALKLTGIEEFIKCFAKYTLAPDYNSDFGAVCYKITREADGTRLSHLKIMGGELKVKDIISDEKVNEIRLYSGEKYTTASVVSAGEICAVTGLNSSMPGNIYGSYNKEQSMYLEPVLTYAVKYPEALVTSSVLTMLRELEEEDPSLRVTYREESREIFISLMGEVQTEILLRKVSERYGVEITLGEGKIAYRETIDDVVEGVGHFEPLRHYAEVHLLMEPLPRGSGMVFEANVSEDMLSRNWQRLIMTHLNERTHRGVLTGSPITDMKITIVAGKAHLKHTEGGDFRQATYRAVRQGLMQATNVLLEPYYNYTLTIPEEFIGRAMTDFDHMYGSCDLISNIDGVATLTGDVPVVTANGYIKEVTRFSRGLGHLSFTVSGYRACHNAEEIMALRGYDPEADLRNPSSSVFCSHGAGQLIPWYEVPDYMHLPYAALSDKNEERDMPEVVRPNILSSIDMTITTEEIDDILNKTSYSNQKKEAKSHKGIPKAVIERQRTSSSDNIPGKAPVYKGTKLKEKILLIDGYNVIHAWSELSALVNADQGAAIGRLLDIISNYQGMTSVPSTIVFDAYRVKNHQTEIMKYDNINIVYTKEGETADHYIEAFTHNNKKYDITVVTSDGIEQIITTGQGANLISSREFEIIVKNTERQFREQYGFD